MLQVHWRPLSEVGCEMIREGNIRRAAVILGMLLLWLGGCASDTDEDSADRGPYFAERVALVGVADLNVKLARPPMHERGVKSIAVVYKGNGNMALWHNVDAFFEPDVFEEMSSPQLISDSFGENLFVTMINQGGFISARGYSQTHSELAEYFGQSIWTWSGIRFDEAKSEALVKDLGRRGHDTVLLVKEIDIYEYYNGNKSVKGAKGVLSSETGVAVYASFQVGLIDTASGELLPLGTQIQASLGEVPNLVGRPGFEAYSTAEKDQILEALKTLVENNVQQTLRIFKIIPVRGQEFLTWEELPESDRVRFDYPE